ncbi:protein kinase C theta type-like [Rhinophrynus dorsalis]
MPFGLYNALAIFQEFINNVLREFLQSCVVVYLDDILIHSLSQYLVSSSAASATLVSFHASSAVTNNIFFIPQGGSSEKPSTAPRELSLEDFTMYHILGEGGYGKVFLGYHNDSGKMVAIKCVEKQHLLGMSRDKIMVEQRVLEVAGGCRFLTHAYATFETEEHLYYVMDYLAGGDLFELLSKNRRLDSDTIKFFAAEMVCGIKFLHSKGIIHRDLKPENVLIDNVGHIKIADFGLAVDDMLGDKVTTGFAGTSGYVAPEIRKKLPYNSAVDWWSFGAVLYNMATGNFPWNLSKSKLEFPSSLLSKNPTRRQRAADTIESHPFFTGINWEELQQGRVESPFMLAKKKPRNHH